MEDSGGAKPGDRVLVLGLDGATFDVIEPLIAKGEMPNLKKLIAEGCASDLISTIHPYSAQAWSSFMTGMNAGKHGILDFTEHVKSEYRLKFLNSSHRDGRTLWGIVGDYGKKVGVVNVPFTYPPEHVNGFIVSGMDAPSVSSNFTYPDDLKNEIFSKVDEYIIEPEVKDFIAQGRPEGFLDAMKRAFDLQVQVLEYLVKEKPWDLFVYVNRLTDQVQHYFWKYYDSGHPGYVPDADEELKDAIPWVYRAMDSVLGELMTWLGDEASIVVMSDHGQGGINGQSVFLNNWLSDQGFLKFRDGGKGPAGRFLNKTLLKKKGGLIDLIRRRVPKGMRNALVKRAPGLKDQLISHGLFSNIDWERTKAYSDEKRANIWINVKGAQGQGIVGPGEEYEEVRRAIIASLATLQDPVTHDPIFPDVYRKEDLYSGPHLDKAPDILLGQGMRKYVYVLQRSGGGRDGTAWIRQMSGAELSSRTNANHRLEGILAVRGKSIKKMGSLPASARIVDVAPTILYMMGLPVPSEMDGKVLLELFSDEYRTAHGVNYCESGGGDAAVRTEYSEAEEAVISRRLKELGYL